MRIGELSRRSGVPVPTIKYYLREGLLAYGEASSPNQVHYAESHLRRLRLVRSLTEIGGLSIARVRAVLEHLDDPGRSEFKRLGDVQYAITGIGAPGDEGGDTAAVDALLARRGWSVSPHNPDRANLAALLERLVTLGRTDVLDRLDSYADAAAALAETDLDVIDAAGAGEAALEAVATITVVGDAVLAALRHLAQEHVAAARRSTSAAQEREAAAAPASADDDLRGAGGPGRKPRAAT